jgi:hypothetical protein
MLVLTGATRCNIPEAGILQRHGRENLKFYIILYSAVARIRLKHKLPPLATMMLDKLQIAFFCFKGTWVKKTFLPIPESGEKSELSVANAK